MANLDDSSEALIRAAFELRNAHGVSLLAELARLTEWRGDLAAMRGEPTAFSPAQPSNTATDERLLMVAALSKAIDRIGSPCCEVLRLRYFERRRVRYAEEQIEICSARLFEIANELRPRVEILADDERVALPSRPSTTEGVDRRR